MGFNSGFKGLIVTVYFNVVFVLRPRNFFQLPIFRQLGRM